MKVQVFSDLHLEHYKSYPKLQSYCDILILNGDIGNYKKKNFKNFITYCSENWKHVIFVLGNHEYYKFNVKLANQLYTKFFETFENVYLLIDDSITIDNYVFIGSTYWTKTTSEIQYTINDFTNIKRFTYSQYIELHKQNENFIKTSINDNKTSDKKIILVTHFPPYYFDTKNKYKSTPQYIKNYFGNSFPIELLKHIDIWIFGHTHSSEQFITHDTQFISNQLGYSDDLDKDFDQKGIYDI
tara:strand:- start:103691 stop:104416 length:726 start_codon:yes stop_codon:yes gene_type:complete